MELEKRIAEMGDEICTLKQTIFDHDVSINNYEKSNGYLIENQK
jgi:hypothetical protein